MKAVDLITEHLDIWTTAQIPKAKGRGKRSNQGIYGIKKLRELILKLAMTGKLVQQDLSDEPASLLLERIAVKKSSFIKEKNIRKPKTLPEVNLEELSFKLPKGWGYTRLGELLNVLNGRAYKKPEMLQTGMPILRVGNLFTSNTWYYSDLDLEPEKYIDNGDLIYAWSASFGPFIWEGGKAIYHYHIWKLDLYSPKALSKNYLYHFLAEKTREIKASGNGIAMIHMTKERMEKLIVPIPPLAEQHRIVTKVDELMALCDQLEQQQTNNNTTHQTLVKTLLATLTEPSTETTGTEPNTLDLFFQHFDTLFTTEESIDQLKQTILQLAVMGKLVPQDPNDDPASGLLKKVAAGKAKLHKEGKVKKQKLLPPVKENEKPFDLQNGWEWIRLNEIVTQLGDGLHGTPQYDENGDFFFINGNNLRDGAIVIKPETKRVNEDEFEKYRKNLNERTVLVSINGTLGNVAFYEREAVVLGKSACYFNLGDGLSKKFIKILIESPYYLTYAFENATGSTIKNLGLKAMNNFPVAMPPLKEQNRIVLKVDGLMALCVTLKARIRASQTTRLQLADALAKQVVI